MPTPATRQPGLRPRSALLLHLERITLEHPLGRKRLVGPDINFGRETLAALARSTGGWIGWEAANLRGIAEELAFVPMAERGYRAGNDVEIGALINSALDRSIEDGKVSSQFRALERSLGFRRALRDTLLEIRIAGIGPASLLSVVRPGSPAHDLPAVLERYERLLEAHRLADPAAVFAIALDVFDREAAFVLDGSIWITPMLGVRGLPGRLVERLVAHGGRVLDADTPIGVEEPRHILAGGLEGARRPQDRTESGEGAGGLRSALAWVEASTLPDARDPRLDALAVATDFFVASTPSEELREVCRRVVAEGGHWDEVEIVATDVDAYGIAMDALSQQLDVKTTMLHGVPLARTRLGRALERWLRWLEGGLPASALRQALEAGELSAPESDVVPGALARGLRRLRIGWGRARYESALVALHKRSAEPIPEREGETAAEHAARVASRRRDDDALARLLRALLAATPPVPELGSDIVIRASAASLARATLDWLALVPLHHAAEQQTATRLSTRLRQLAAVEDHTTSFSNALASLREALADLRAWPLLTDDRKPWSAAGGMIHLTDLAHAGCTGRRRTFVVGLDAGRAAGSSRQDPLFPDAARALLPADTLKTSASGRAEARWLAAQSLGSMRGRVTLSYSIAASADGRESGPAPQLLQAWRIHQGDASLSYDALRAALGPPACAVPVRGASEAMVVDARDVWMETIADGPLLLDATPLLADAFPTLANGLLAIEAANGDALTAYHGLVPAASALDPRLRAASAISPSALEKLAKCPLAWFYHYGLSLFLPDDPGYDAERWLSDMHRGTLLHQVFEEFVNRYRGRQGAIADESARVEILGIARDCIEEWRTLEPPPGEAVFQAECAELERAALSFLEMERSRALAGDGGTWMHVELAFGGEAPAGVYRLADGATLSVKGIADRVDRLPDGSLRVIDYKTGRPARFRSSPKVGAFNGGRHLQPALYAAVVETLLGAPVATFEYRFPTERGENEIVSFTRDELTTARGIIADLLDHVVHGHFVPTTAKDDCSYCDYQSICRAQSGRFASTSPRAEWAEANAAKLDAYRTMLHRRAKGGVS